MTAGHPRVRLLLLFALLAAAHTWPLAAHPGTWSRLDSADASLNTWAIAWVAHTLPSHPLGLFDANIFYPARYTLAYSEPLIVQGILAIPVTWAGGSPVLAYGLVTLAGFALTAWAMSLLMLRWTGSMTAAIVAGSAAAFNAHMLVRLPHVQALHVEFLPLALFALDELLESGRLKHAALVAVAVALQGLASIYALLFTGWALVCAGAARPWWPSPARLRTSLLLVGAAGTTVVLLAPVLYPYYFISHSYGLVRSVEESRFYSSTWTDYLFTGARVHFDLWSSRFQGSADANFPGLVVAALGVLAVMHGARTNRVVRMAVGMIVGCVLLSLWPRLPGFEWAHDHLPLVGAIRAYSRAGQFALMGFAILAGGGAAVLEARWGAHRRWPWIAASLVLLVNLEALRAPMAFVPFDGVPPIYEVLAARPGGAVLELPQYGPTAEFRNAPYMVNSTWHWRPIVNGYSGFKPPEYDGIWRTLHDLPDDKAFAWLREHHVTEVVLHRAEFKKLKGPDQLDRVEHAPELELQAAAGDIAIYDVGPPPPQRH